MHGRGEAAFAWVLTVAALCAQSPSPDPLSHFRTNVHRILQRFPDYTCMETIARSVRVEPGAPFRPLDTLRLHVGWIGGQERYGWPTAAGFDDRELRELVRRGLTSHGNFAGHVKHIFLSDGVEFTARGTEELRGRPARRYDYDIPAEYSRYKIRSRPAEAEVAVRGSFWFDAETLDLLRIEVVADEITPELGILRFAETVEYARKAIGNSEAVVPVTSEITVQTLQGDEFRNRATFDECRQFQAEANLLFDVAGKPEAEPPSASREAPPSAPVQGPEPLPPSLRVDLVLSRDIDLTQAGVGDVVTATVARPVVEGERHVVREGSVVQGRLVRVERSSHPFEHYVVGLEFHTVGDGDRTYALFATMQDAGPMSGLLRQAKRLNPTFQRRRTGRLDILVREKPRGEGILHWDARRPLVRRGLKMQWLTFDPAPDSADESVPAGPR